jgi:hypothetical protein
MPSTPVQQVCSTLSSPMSIFDNRDGGNKELPAGNYTAQAQYRQNLTLYYVYAADDKFVPHDHPVLHCWLRVEDDSSVTFGE